MRDLAWALARLIRIDALWLCAEPVDMRAGPQTLLGRVVQRFGQAEPHHGYVFANRRGTRLKLLAVDGFGLWLAARQLHQGRFVWPRAGSGEARLALRREQFDALVLGLPWSRVGAAGVIRVL